MRNASRDIRHRQFLARDRLSVQFGDGMSLLGALAARHVVIARIEVLLTSLEQLLLEEKRATGADGGRKSRFELFLFLRDDLLRIFDGFPGSDGWGIRGRGGGSVVVSDAFHDPSSLCFGENL